MVKSRGLGGGAGVWLRKRLEADAVPVFEPGEPAVAERRFLLVLILRYLVPKEARLRLKNLTTDDRCSPLREQPLRESSLKRRVSLHALLLARGLRRSDLLVKMAVPSTQNFTDCSLPDWFAKRLLKPLAEGLL